MSKAEGPSLDITVNEKKVRDILIAVVMFFFCIILSTLLLVPLHSSFNHYFAYGHYPASSLSSSNFEINSIALPQKQHHLSHDDFFIPNLIDMIKSSVVQISLLLFQKIHHY